LKTSPSISAALSDILVDTAELDEKYWVKAKHEPGVMWRPIMFNQPSGSRVELLRGKRGGQLTTHIHPGPVHGYTIYGTWYYLEHDWVAHKGSYLFEPPGDCHTLTCGDCDEMMAIFFLSGALLYVDESQNVIGDDDNQTILDKAREHYDAVGLGASFVEQFVR